MTEERSDRADRPAGGIWRPLVLGGAAIVGLTVLGVVLLYVFGDPRPRTIDAAQVGGGLSAIPEVVAGEDYFRVRAEFIPLPPASETQDPIGKVWAAMFGDSVADTGAAEVRVIFEQADSPTLSEGGDGVLLAAPSDGPAKSAATAFFARLSGTTARVRLDVIRRKEAGKGLLPALQAGFGSDGVQSSGWISVFPGDRPGGGGLLGPDTALRPVRDFTGRVVAAVRIGIEARRSIVFGEDFVAATAQNPALERLILDNRTAEAMRAAVQGLIDRNLPSGYRDPAYRRTLAEQLDRIFVGPGNEDPTAVCRTGFTRLSGDLGLSAADAGLLAFLAWPGHREAVEDGPVCGDDRLQRVLASIGAPVAAASAAAAIAREEEQRKLAAAKAKAKAAAEAGKAARNRYVCLGVSGERIEALCTVLDEIAGEWRAGVKLLNMEASRRHILEGAGLEEPTLDMSYATGRIENRRQLLIHIALARVENFACFRLVRRNPIYFEALVLMREGDEQAEPRLDVFEFAFNDEGRIARIRRRTAVTQDLDEAMALPETSRCRREFLSDRAAALRQLIRRQWQLPATSG